MKHADNHTCRYSLCAMPRPPRYPDVRETYKSARAYYPHTRTPERPRSLPSAGERHSDMAITSTSPETDTCTYCDDPFDPPTGQPGYCAPACYYRERGANILHFLKHDHTTCATCYGTLKEIEQAPAYNAKGPAFEPRLDCPECDHTFRPRPVFGRELNLEDSTTARCPECEHTFSYDRPFPRGPKDISDGYQYATDRVVWGIDDVDDDPYQRLEVRRWSCECGTVNPSHEHGFIQRLGYDAAITNLFHAVEDAHRRDAVAHSPDRERFLAGFHDPWRGAEWAVGYAVYGGERND